jgi:pimeloyl-ACP methyl ester carboxylesterase
MKSIASKMRLLSLAALAMGLGGCATSSLPDLTQAHGPCFDQDGGWCGFTRSAAVVAWPYAQLASNAYCDSSEIFDLPAGYTVIRRLPAQDICDLERAAAKGDLAAKAKLKPIHKAERKLKTHGFNYTVYDKRTAAGALERRVIAFRGTDSKQLADWVYGNLGNTQRDQGIELYAQERRKLDDEGGKSVPITVTGHSLGGAIAIQVSLENPGVDAYVFNTSPRYTLLPPNTNQRVAIAERGDILEVLRNRSMPTRQDMLIINCHPTEGRVASHAIRDLAECVTWIAAKDDAGARASVATNKLLQPEGEVSNLRWGLPPDPAIAPPVIDKKAEKAKKEQRRHKRERRTKSANQPAPIPQPAGS